MDRFDRNALIACVILSAIIIAFYYVGTALGKSLEGTDGQVVDAAAAIAGATPHSSLYELDQNGEYVGFTITGLCGGFFAGYLWPMVFEEPGGRGGRGAADG